MKTNHIISLIGLSLAMLLFSFTANEEIKNCYLSYKGSKTLTAVAPFRLPKEEARPRKVTTNKDEAEVSMIDGYKIEYNNEKNKTFVDLKVVLSDPKVYAKDTANVLENLKYLNTQGKNMETKELIILNFNGARIYGISHSSIEKENR